MCSDVLDSRGGKKHDDDVSNQDQFCYGSFGLAFDFISDSLVGFMKLPPFFLASKLVQENLAFDSFMEKVGACYLFSLCLSVCLTTHLL